MHRLVQRLICHKVNAMQISFMDCGVAFSVAQALEDLFDIGGGPSVSVCIGRAGVKADGETKA